MANDSSSRIVGWRALEDRHLALAGERLRALLAAALQSAPADAPERPVLAALLLGLSGSAGQESAAPGASLLAWASPFTLRALCFDLLRYLARLAPPPSAAELPTKLHLGCGRRLVAGWLNVDVHGTCWNVDLASGKLPWRDGVFSAVVSQHLVEHLRLPWELVALLSELRRVSRPDGVLWFSFPDLARVCADYVATRGRALRADRLTRRRVFDGRDLEDVPPQHFINHLFHQDGEHKNLYDLELFGWALRQAGFTRWEQTTEEALRAEHPDFPPRNDGLFTLYVRVLAAPREPASLDGDQSSA